MNRSREKIKYREQELSGRYINVNHIKTLLEKHSANFNISVLGQSVLGEDIHFIKVGSGDIRILMWSQMHGNESTTTKSIFDLLNRFSDSGDPTVMSILKKCCIGIIPILNPDGARSYSRLNANGVDLNRDAQDLTQPESQILKACFNEFQPDFCFNLHGQRTIFSVGKRSNSATVSFLSPAQDEDRTVTPTRRKAMDLIVVMNRHLQEMIPDQVGIYDGSFNINCVGDSFQSLGVPTVLFEAGHYLNDYQREKTRDLISEAMWLGLTEIASNEIKGQYENEYFSIPQNDKLFYDIIIRNVKLENNKDEITDVAIQYKEHLENGLIAFQPVVAKVALLENYFGHSEIDGKGKIATLKDEKEIKEGDEIDFVLLNQEKLSLYPEIN